MAGPVKSFTDLQRELISAQMEQRRVSERNAAELAGRVRADDEASMRQPVKLTVLKD